ncbi:MAG: M3 family metallopeptidase, partial [Acidobacteriota bacterium]|nr:M3 family metallopeptidase [Acidobacteriota bacterium]
MISSSSPLGARLLAGIVVLAGAALIAASSRPPVSGASGNPFFADFDTPFQVPPFDRIKPEHFLPAFEKGMAEQQAAVAAIVADPAPPDYENTIAALDRSDKRLTAVNRVFGGLASADTNDELKAIQKEISPRLAAHRDEINLNKKLFERIKAVYEKRASLGLDAERTFVLENLYKSYIRNGAGLDEAGRAALREINQKLSRLSVQYNQNVLNETNAFRLVVDKEADLAGLPESSLAAAAEAAKAAGLEGRWLFTTQKPSMIPFLTFAQNRALREKIYTAYIKRGDNDNEYDNKKILSDIIKLRVERARLLGYKTYADYVLETRMAKNPQNVYDLLNRLWAAALKVAKKEAGLLQGIIDRENGGFKLAPWDWWYYAEKLRKERYDLDDAELRPYFVLDNVRDGAFWTASQLYGLTFTPLPD